MMKKARKRLGEFGIRTHYSNLSEIYLIKNQILMLFLSKEWGGAGSSSIPRGTLEPLHLVIKSPCLQIFAKKCYSTLKIVKILKKGVQNQNCPLQDSNLSCLV